MNLYLCLFNPTVHIYGPASQLCPVGTLAPTSEAVAPYALKLFHCIYKERWLSGASLALIQV